MPCTGNEVGRQGAAVAQRIEGGDSCAEQRAGFGGVKAFRNRRERFHGSDHIFLIAAVITDSRSFQVEAIGKISPAAGDTSAVLPAVPADADALAFFPAHDAGA